DVGETSPLSPVDCRTQGIDHFIMSRAMRQPHVPEVRSEPTDSCGYLSFSTVSRIFLLSSAAATLVFFSAILPLLSMTNVQRWAVTPRLRTTSWPSASLVLNSPPLPTGTPNFLATEPSSSASKAKLSL